MTKTQKKEQIRQLILQAATQYCQKLAGKNFLYIYGNHAFEVSFPECCFLHLTGVTTTLSANAFFDNAKKCTLTTQQFNFSPSHPFANAKKKLPCLVRLPELTENLVCVVCDMQTQTLVYKLGLTNLEFSLGLTENVDASGNLIDSKYLPRTLRVRDNAIDNSQSGEFIDFIFTKSAAEEQYDKTCYADAGKKVPKCLAHYLDVSLTQTMVGDI